MRNSRVIGFKRWDTSCFTHWIVYSCIRSRWTHYFFIFTNCWEDNPTFKVLVQDCRWLLQRFPLKEVNRVFREANQYADLSVSLGRNLTENFVLYLHTSLEFLFLFFIVVDFDISNDVCLQSVSGTLLLNNILHIYHTKRRSKFHFFIFLFFFGVQK